MEHYDKLPFSQLNRRNRKIEIVLQAPGFSEHFDGRERLNHINKFDIPDNIKGLSETQLAKILVDKYFEAIQIIKSKVKKDDVFDFDTFENVLNSVQQKITPDFLQMNSAQGEVKRQEAQIKFSETGREKRQKQNLPNDTLIRDLRLYYVYQLPSNLFYLNRFADIVLQLLIEKDFKCPKYHHLYISIADTRAEALKRARVLEDWFTFGIAVLREETLINAGHAEQQNLVLDAIAEGLLDIAELDKLDKTKISEAINEARNIGVLSEIDFKAKENNKIAFVISTKAILGHNENEIYFTIIDKVKNRSVKWKFGQENIFLIAGWFGTINVTNKKITIKPRANMDLVLEGKQKIIEIDVERELSERTI